MAGGVIKRWVCLVVLAAFTLTSVVPSSRAQSALSLPPPGQMVALSPAFNPSVLKGIKVYPDNPLRFDFILDKGDDKSTDAQIKTDSTRLIKYFLASLTIPEKDLWVNLSPYEKDRIVPEDFGQTEMGRDLLAQDYLLKQITSSLLYPEGDTGKKFWQKVYALAQEKYGTTDIPVDTFNKVWIVPEKAVVYENGKVGAAYVTESRLKVMLETDYLATSNNVLPTGGHDALLGTVSPSPLKATQGDSQPLAVTENDIAKSVLREIVIPVLEKEVNEGKSFAQLRQVYQSLILATWYKKKIKQSLLSAVYVDRKKTDGVSIPDPKEAEKIWGQYVEAFKKGAYNFVKEERDMFTDNILPRKYFSGGIRYDSAMVSFHSDSAEIPLAGTVNDTEFINVTIALHTVGIATFDPLYQKALLDDNAQKSVVTPINLLFAAVLGAGIGKFIVRPFIMYLFFSVHPIPLDKVNYGDTLTYTQFGVPVRGFAQPPPDFLPESLMRGLSGVYLVPDNKLFHDAYGVKFTPDSRLIGFYQTKKKRIALNAQRIDGIRETLERYWAHEAMHYYYAMHFNIDEKMALEKFYKIHRDIFHGISEYAFSGNKAEEAIAELAGLWVTNPAKTLAFYLRYRDMGIGIFFQHIINAFSSPALSVGKIVRLYHDGSFSDEFFDEFSIEEVMTRLTQLNPKEKVYPLIGETRFIIEGHTGKKLSYLILQDAVDWEYVVAYCLADNEQQIPLDVENLVKVLRASNPGAGSRLRRGEIINANFMLNYFESQKGRSPVKVVPSVNGGIDFNSSKLDLQIQNAGSGSDFPIDPAMLQQMQNATGFLPVIIGLQPINSLNGFLGLADQPVSGIKPG